MNGKISEHQPYIYKLAHYCQAIEKSKQLDFAVVVSNKIWSGLKNWNTDESIADATSKVGLKFEDIEKIRIENEQALIDEIKLNQKEQLEAGHHGVPLSVYKDKFFFGQDRFDDLVSELKKDGLVIS